MNGYTIDAIVEISISCQMNNYTTGCAARELYMRAPLAGLPLVCREYLKEASRCTIQEGYDVCLDDPPHLALVHHLLQGAHGVVGTAPRPKPIRAASKVLLVDGF